MITDKLEKLGMYTLEVKAIPIIIDFLKENNLKELACGRYEIFGDDVYLSLQEYTTKPIEGAYPELHRRYIDIQMVISGQENIGYTDISNISLYKNYDDDNDIEFVQGEVEFFKADNTNFYIFFPEDAHMPSIAIDNPLQVKKAVFKIKI